MKKIIIAIVVIASLASCDSLTYLKQNNVSTTFYNKTNYTSVNRNGVHQTEKKCDPPKPATSYAER